jgi:hypothetical protein
LLYNSAEILFGVFLVVFVGCLFIATVFSRNTKTRDELAGISICSLVLFVIGVAKTEFMWGVAWYLVVVPSVLFWFFLFVGAIVAIFWGVKKLC